MNRTLLTKAGNTKARTTTSQIATALAATAGPAAAAVNGSGKLTPSQSVCTASQFASYKVYVSGTATADGARFKILRNGVVVYATPGRQGAFNGQLSSAIGNFPGPGNYQFCAFNTGTNNTNVTLALLTDGEF